MLFENHGPDSPITVSFEPKVLCIFHLTRLPCASAVLARASANVPARPATATVFNSDFIFILPLPR
jgi:hypothetical protein